MQHTPERLKTHIKSYDKAKTLFEVDLEQSSEGQPSQKKPALLQAKLPVSSTGKDLQEAIDRQVCRFLVATNSPFSLVENCEFLKLINLLRPGAKVANRRAMGGRLLDEVHEEEIVKVRQRLEDRSVTFTVSSEPVVGIAISCDGLSYLVDSIDTTGHPHTIEYLAELVPPLISTWN